MTVLRVVGRFLVVTFALLGLLITFFYVYALWSVRAQLPYASQLRHNIPFSPVMVVVSVIIGAAYVAHFARRS